ncbi:hypothetical protein EKL29_14495 [Pantoea sp. YU22]|uniref:glucosyltransferase domain-containing protein n=1 Tax=Pantoea sp. YU22 TaxID=2497684 RepID=UPI000F886345|nr:glucosyltransferase domain-containing protein [Pantoea sp. YU22]RTY56870.1 hypothetical protein EKL29_14495 [Pantoea sp. YU22]
MISSVKTLTNRTVILLFSLLVCLYTLPIILTGRLYIDDLGRTLYGYAGWGLNGRPLSDVIMQAMSLGGELLDLSPLTQIISVFVLCLALYYYTRRNFTGISLAGAMTVSFLFIANPFYIENLSYKFDSLTMALSMVLLMLPYTVTEKKSINSLLSVILIIASLSLYQASIGLFAIMAVIEAAVVKSDRSNKEVFYSIAQRAIQLAVAFVLYKIFIASNFVKDDYNVTHSEMVKLSSDSIPVIIDNIHNLSWFLKSYLSTIPTTLRMVVVAAIAYSVLRMSFDLCREGYKKHIISILLVLFSPALVVILALIPLVILKSPVFAPRVLLALSGAIMLYGFMIFRSVKHPVILAVIFVPLVWINFVYSYSFASASRSQGETDRLIASSVFQDALHSGEAFKYVTVSGEMPKSRQLLIAENKLPLMSKLVPVYLNYDWVWGSELLNHYGMSLEFKVLGSEKSNLICKGRLVSKGNVYSLYSYNDILIIDFLNIKC